jgi:hypothetical protein
VKKVQLTIFERLTLRDVLGGLRQISSNDMRQAFKIMDILSLTDAQEKKIELEETPIGVKWSPEKAKKIDKCEVELEDADFDFLKKKVEDTDKSGNWTQMNRLIPPMVEKIMNIK